MTTKKKAPPAKKTAAKKAAPTTTKAKAKAKPTGKAKVLHMATHHAKQVQAAQPAKPKKAPKDAALPRDTYQAYELLEDLPALVKAQQTIKTKMAAKMAEFSVVIDGEKLNWAEADAKDKELRGLMEALLVAEGLEGVEPDQFVMVSGLKVKRTVKKGKKEISKLLLIEKGVPLEVIDESTVEGNPSTYVTVRDPKKKGAEEEGDVERTA